MFGEVKARMYPQVKGVWCFATSAATSSASAGSTVSGFSQKVGLPTGRTRRSSGVCLEFSEQTAKPSTAGFLGDFLYGDVASLEERLRLFKAPRLYLFQNRVAGGLVEAEVGEPS